MVKWIFRIVIGLVAAVLLLAGAGLGYRAWRQDQAEGLLVLAGPDAVDEAKFVTVRGTEQWITVRGQDRNNPVLLIVHGGPGAALSPLALAFLPFERDYVVVQWDQQGAGRTFTRAGRQIPGDLTSDDLVQDGVAVAETVRRELGKDRLILVGASWGSMIAARMARERPDLFYAFVGTGQAVHRDDGRIAAYRLLLERARSDRNAGAVADLERIGPPPYSDEESARLQNSWMDAYSPDAASPLARIGAVLLTPRTSLSDVRDYFGAFMASDEHFDTGLIDLRQESNAYALPVFIIQGTDDFSTPESLARAYFDSLDAPEKMFIPVQGGGHTLLVDRTDAFVAILNERVRPLATTPTGG